MNDHHPAAPGFYPGPQGDPRRRYWDGERWTDAVEPLVSSEGGTRKRKRGPRRLAIALAAALLLLAGLAGGGVYAKQRIDDRRAAQAAAERERAREQAEAQAEEERLERAKTCGNLLAPLLDELGEVNSRLSIGMTVRDYNTALGDVRVVYDRMDFSSVGADPHCLGAVGLPLEDAFNSYVEAGTTWGDCVTNFDCDIDSAMPGIQEKWQAAGTKLEEARAALDAYQPEGSSRS